MLDSSLMQLMWLASPALPIGGFSYSECLEAAVESALVTTETEASDWLVDQLHSTLAHAPDGHLQPRVVRPDDLRD